MSARFLTTVVPIPAGFTLATLSKRELLSGTVVLLLRTPAELLAALPAAVDRVRGLLVTLDGAGQWHRLGPALWHLAIPASHLAKVHGMLPGFAAVLEDGQAAAELARRREIEVARLRADLQSTRRDYNESVSRLGDRMADVVALNADLRESEERFRALVEASSDWIWELDAGAVYTYSSPRVRDLLGYEPREILGRGFFDLLAPEESASVLPAYEAAVRERRPFIGLENANRHRDGRLVVLETSAVPILDAQGGWHGFRGIGRDITDRKRAEAERLDLERRILHSQKLESLGVLAGGIAHDFNNLLVSILGNAELALLELPAANAGREAVADIRRAAVRASELTNQLLAYSGKGRFVVETLDLGSLVREMTRLLEVSICKRARLHCELAADLPAVEADAAQLRQIVMNLVTNASEAIESTHLDGTISLRTGLARFAQADLLHTALGEDLPAGAYVILEVTDTGCGMTDDVKTRLFDPFFTTKFHGRGLGLAAVQGIVRGHRGTLSITSEPGAGTCIQVLLPAAAGPGKITQVQPFGSQRPWQDGGTALIIDDDDAVRMVAAQILSRLGFSVLSAENGARGLEIFRARSRDIDFVLLDLTMPVMGGEQTFVELRRVRPDVRIILISGYNEQDATSRFAEAGLAGFLQKPFTINALAAVIRATLER